MIFKGQAVTYTTPGHDLGKVLGNTEITIDSDKLGDTEVVVRAVATPINPSDVHQVSGSYPSPPTLQHVSNSGNSGDKVAVGGNEGVFEVVAIGSKVDNYQIGDWVIPRLPSFGTWRTHAVADAANNPFQIIDSSLSALEAGTISINPCTAVQIFHQFVTDWQKGDWIVSNAGNSLVNQFLVQIARNEGVNVLLVIRNGKPDENELKQHLLGYGAKSVLTAAEFSDPKIVSSIIGKDNVRLALNSVGDETVLHMVNYLTEDGILVTYGQSVKNATISYSLGLQLFKNISTRAYWLTKNTRKNPQSKVDTVNKVVQLYKQKKIKAAPVSEVKFKDGNLAEVFLKSIASSQKQVVFYE